MSFSFYRLVMILVLLLAMLWLVFPADKQTVSTLLGPSPNWDPNIYQTTYYFGWPLVWLEVIHSRNQVKNVESYQFHALNSAVHLSAILVAAFLIVYQPSRGNRQQKKALSIPKK